MCFPEWTNLLEHPVIWVVKIEPPGIGTQGKSCWGYLIFNPLPFGSGIGLGDVKRRLASELE